MGDGEVQRSPACRSPWGRSKESDVTGWLSCDACSAEAGGRKISWEAIALVRWGWKKMCHGEWGSCVPNQGRGERRRCVDKPRGLENISDRELQKKKNVY